MIRILELPEVEKYINDDPVRPHLTADFRTSCNGEVYGLFEDTYAAAHEPMLDPLAIICVAYTNEVPESEESLKFLALYWYLRPKVEFNEPMDAIVYGVLISLGFATLENIEYVYLYNPDQSLVISIMRAFTAIPLHSMCGVIMGFMFGFYIFYGVKKYLVYSILIPIIIHSTYNFLTDQNILIFLVYMISIIFYTSKLFLQIKKIQSTKLKEAQVKLF